MAIINLHPDFFTYEKVTGATEGHYDDNGNWVEGSATAETVTVACKATVPGSAGGASKVPLQDGTLVEFGWLLLHDKDVEVPAGTNVKIYVRDQLHGTGTVKRSLRQQTNGKTWV